jgi:hypothetical protein
MTDVTFQTPAVIDQSTALPIPTSSYKKVALGNDTVVNDVAINDPLIADDHFFNGPDVLNVGFSVPAIS